MPGLILNLTDEQVAVIAAVAQRYALTPRELILQWIGPALDEATKLRRAEQWQKRQRALEADPALAATVDAAVPS